MWICTTALTKRKIKPPIVRGLWPRRRAFAGEGWGSKAADLRGAIRVFRSSPRVIYRYGPSRKEPQWRWVSWGSALAALLWLVTSILFSWYAGNFGNYDKTYGSLGAAVGLMTWMWLSFVVILVGAELDAEMEHQTARDTTTGSPKPMGSRGRHRREGVLLNPCDGRNRSRFSHSSPTVRGRAKSRTDAAALALAVAVGASDGAIWESAKEQLRRPSVSI
jgi:hypothetical protein